MRFHPENGGEIELKERNFHWREKFPSTLKKLRGGKWREEKRTSVHSVADKAGWPEQDKQTQT